MMLQFSPPPDTLERLDDWLLSLTPTQRWLLALLIVEAVLLMAFALRGLLR